MRKIISIILILSAIPAYSQTKLSGKYEMISHEEMLWWEYDTFWFDSSGSFKFSRYTDYGTTDGNGKYEINGNHLNLSFEKPDTIMPHVLDDYRILMAYELEDSVIYKIKIFDFDTGEPLPGALVVIKINYMDGYLKKEKILLGAEVGMYGYAELKFSPIHLPCQLEISYIDYYFFSYEITDNKSRNIEVKLTKDRYPFISFFTNGETLSFKFKYISNDIFHLKRKDLDLEDWFIYKKTGEYHDK